MTWTRSTLPKPDKSPYVHPNQPSFGPSSAVKFHMGSEVKEHDGRYKSHDFVNSGGEETNSSVDTMDKGSSRQLDHQDESSMERLMSGEIAENDYLEERVRPKRSANPVKLAGVEPTRRPVN
jgi:hypothetical protein